MPTQYQCRACGSTVHDHELWSGQAKRDGPDVYCTECSTLIAEPGGQEGGAQERVPPSNARASNSGRRAAASGRRVAARPSARGAGSSARHPAPRASARRVEPEARRRPSSNRMQPSSGRRASAQRVEPAASSSSRRAAAPRARPVSSRRATGGLAQVEPQNVEFSSATSRVHATRASRRETGARGGFSSRGSTANGQKSNITVIGIISAGLVVIGLVALLASTMGRGPSTPRARGKEETSPQEYVQMASEQERMHNKMKAREYWILAAESWERMGQTREAEQCIQRANDIGKSMRLQDFR